MILIILACFCTVTCVSAIDSNSTDIAVNDADGPIGQDVNLAKEDSDEYLSDANKSDSSISFSNEISFRYDQSGSTDFAVEGGSISDENIHVAGHSEAKIVLNDNKITVSGLAAGSYTLNVVTTPDADHNEVNATVGITVSKASATIKASKLTVAYKKGTGWSIKLLDSQGKAIKNTKITLKIYTGKKSKTVSVTTNSKGVVTYKTSSLAVGTHKIVISLSNANYAAKSVTSSVKVIKQTALKIYARSITNKECSTLVVVILNKATKKTR